MKKTFVILSLIAGSFALIKCSPKATKPVAETNTPKAADVATTTPAAPTTPTAPATPSYSDADVAAGHSVYDKSCGNCHKLYDPANFNAARWTVVLNAMIPKSKLSATDAALVRAYVFSNAKKG